jgi:ParB family transcriptional regulator, chromosome partitioning protein
MNIAKGLGRGLDSLIPTEFDSSLLKTTEKIESLPIERVNANPNQPRKNFDEKSIAELAESIKAHGIVQPLVVTRAGSDYRIIAGERRYRAAKLAGLADVPAIVRSMKDLEELEVALIENVQRVDLSPLEQAVSIQRLHEQFSMDYSGIAKRLGKAPTTVNNIVRLLGLPENAKQALAQNKITEGHARAVLALKDNTAKQDELLANIIEKQWSVRQAEQFVTALKKSGAKPQTVADHMAKTTPQTKKLSQKLGTAITIKRTAKGGRLEIHFKDDNQLSGIISQLT